MKVVSFKVDEDMFETLEDYAKKRNMAKSEIIRRALEQYMMSDKKKPFITKRIKIYT